jgi:TatD DNase family protein
MPYTKLYGIFLFHPLKEPIPFINIHTHQPPQGEGIAIVNTKPGEAAEAKGYISAGIHPWHISSCNIPQAIEQLRSAASLKHVLAIGECGLDRLADTLMQQQEQIFTEQIRIAAAVSKPLIIHCVKAFDELVRIRKKENTSVPYIIHGYNNNGQIASQLLKNGMYLSFGKALLTEGSNAQRILRNTDPELFFLETDDAAVSINSIFEMAAALKNMAPEELKEKMMLNFKRLFNHE